MFKRNVLILALVLPPSGAHGMGLKRRSFLQSCAVLLMGPRQAATVATVAVETLAKQTASAMPVAVPRPSEAMTAYRTPQIQDLLRETAHRVPGMDASGVFNLGPLELDILRDWQLHYPESSAGFADEVDRF